MNQQVQNIIAQNATKKARIEALLELGLTRVQIAELRVLGEYGAIQNVFAKWQAGRSGNTSTRLLFTPSVFNKRFGVEIEACGIDRNRVAQAVRRTG